MHRTHVHSYSCQDDDCDTSKKLLPKLTSKISISENIPYNELSKMKPSKARFQLLACQCQLAAQYNVPSLF